MQPVVSVVPAEWNLQFIESYFAQVAPAGQLPIPSQHNGICGSDSLAMAFFYADELRPFFWSALILGLPQIIADCHHTLQTYDEARKAEILACWLNLWSARTAGVLRTHMASLNAVRRLPSEPYGQAFPVGDTCNRVAAMYEGVNVKEDVPGGIGLAVSGQDAIAKALSTMMGANFKFEYTDTIPPNLDSYVVAIYVMILTPEDEPHQVSIVKIRGEWYWCDNNVGWAVPLKPLLTNEIGQVASPLRAEEATFSTTYRRGDRVDIRMYHWSWGDKRISFGQNYGPLRQKETWSERNPNVVTVRPEYKRRYLLAIPGSGTSAGALNDAAGIYANVRARQMSLAQKYGLGGPTIAAPAPDLSFSPRAPSTGSVGYGSPLPSMGSTGYGSPLPSMGSTGSLGPGVRNPNDPQALVKDVFNTWGGRRRKLTSRQSSLPKRKAPSSGHSRGYTRRQRASRSGRGGYRPTRTGRKV